MTPCGEGQGCASEPRGPDPTSRKTPKQFKNGPFWRHRLYRLPGGQAPPDPPRKRGVGGPAKCSSETSTILDENDTCYAVLSLDSEYMCLVRCKILPAEKSTKSDPKLHETAHLIGFTTSGGNQVCERACTEPQPSAGKCS